MADLNDREVDHTDEETAEILRVAPEPPDMSDLEKIIVNIELRNGEQYSIVFGRQDEMTLSLDLDHEGEFQTIVGNDSDVRTIFYGPQAWELVLRLE